MARKKNKTGVGRNTQASAILNEDGGRSLDPSGGRRELAGTTEVSKDYTTKGPEEVQIAQDHLESTRMNVEIVPQVDSVGSYNGPAKRPSFNKRPRQEDAEATPLLSAKRTKLNQDIGLDQRPHPSDESSSQDVGDVLDESIPNKKSAIHSKGECGSTQTENFPAEVQHLEQKFEISSMSILSSSKIESRVRNLLERVGKSTCDNTKSKPGMVILAANADVAGKMCSIVQIAKSKIEEEKGKWWQYSRLTHKIVESKWKHLNRAEGRSSTSERQQNFPKETNRIKESLSDVVDTSIRAQEGEKGVRDTESPVDEGEDLSDEFETMRNPKVRDCAAVESHSVGGKKFRNTPVMSIFFTRVPVPDLKKLYGEQTNA